MGFDPITMGVVALGSAGISAVGALEEGQAASNAANYNAAVAGFNAQQATRNAAMASETGSAKAAMQGRETRAAFGSERAREAGGGLSPNSGSATDVQQSTAELGHLDALTIRTNAAKEAYGYQVQSTNFQNEGELDRYSAKQAKTASQIKAASTLLGGASNAATQYQIWKANTSPIDTGISHPNTEYGMDEL